SRSSSSRTGSGADKGSERAGDRLDGLLDVLVLDPEIGGRTQDARAQDADEDAVIGDPRSCLGYVLHLDPYEVRLYRLRVDAEARIREPLGEPAGAAMIVREALDVVVERVQHPRGDDARLAEGAAEEELPAPGALYRLLRAREDRAQRTPEPRRAAAGD